jgi:CRISPR-associated protein Cas5h
MYGFKFRIEVPYFTTFRNVATTSLINTYKIPPFTTIRGLLSNAMGFKRDNLKIQDYIDIGIKPHNIQYSSELSKYLKLKGNGKFYKRFFPSSPIFKQFLINPSYDIFIGGKKEDLLKIYDSLNNPARNLYIGSSDELVDINIFKPPLKIHEVNSVNVSTVLEGIHEECIIEKIPYKFIKSGKSFSLETKMVSIPNNTVLVDNAYNFNGENVILI